MFMTASAWEAAMARRGGVCHPVPDPGFKEKQGQYLAFIYAYTHLRLHARERPPARRDRYAALLQCDAAQCAPDGAHAGARWVDPPPAGGSAQHRGAGRPRTLACPALIQTAITSVQSY